MKLERISALAILMAALLVSAATTMGQNAGPNVETDGPGVDSVSAPGAAAHGSVTADRLLTQSTETLGPTLPEDIKLPESSITNNALTNWGKAHRLRFFGWVDGGYTWSSAGSGLLNVEPRENRFGNAFLLDQATFVLERTLDQESWSWGFRSEFYMGADASLLHPINGFGPNNERFSTDFRQAYFAFHAPILTAGGIDFKLGRQYVPMGYETTMAPYRPMYSIADGWMYSQNGATTGAIATIHVSPRLDVVTGATLGVNALFDYRGRAPSYIARGLYWLNSSKRTKLIGTFYAGPEPIAPAKGHLGKWQSEVEVQLIHNVNRRLTLVSETNAGWDTRDPANHLKTSEWYGTYGMGIVHVCRQLDLNSRAEWLKDADGSRIGTRSNYGEITLGPNYMPTRMINFRPEVRWDVASNRVFGSTGSTNLKSHQWTAAVEMLIKF